MNAQVAAKASAVTAATVIPSGFQIRLNPLIAR